MSGKLNRSKFFALMLLMLMSVSCGGREKKFNTEIFCPDGTRILVKFARLEEIREAIKKADADKKFFHTTEGYTVIKLPHTRSFRIEKIPPEEMLKCFLRESEMGVIDKTYIHHF